MTATLITIDDGSQWLVSLDYTAAGKIQIVIGRQANDGQRPTSEQVIAVVAAARACLDALREE